MECTEGWWRCKGIVLFYIFSVFDSLFFPILLYEDFIYICQTLSVPSPNSTTFAYHWQNVKGGETLRKTNQQGNTNRRIGSHTRSIAQSQHCRRCCYLHPIIRPTLFSAKLQTITSPSHPTIQPTLLETSNAENKTKTRNSETKHSKRVRVGNCGTNWRAWAIQSSRT